jgi:hypothetical protein
MQIFVNYIKESLFNQADLNIHGRLKMDLFMLHYQFVKMLASTFKFSIMVSRMMAIGKKNKN